MMGGLNVWCSEDGGEWFAEGHIKREAMIAGVLACEKESGDFDDFEAEYDPSEMKVSHYWVIECEHNTEACHIVAEGTPKAIPMTMAL